MPQKQSNVNLNFGYDPLMTFCMFMLKCICFLSSHYFPLPPCWYEMNSWDVALKFCTASAVMKSCWIEGRMRATLRMALVYCIVTLTTSGDFQCNTTNFQRGCGLELPKLHKC